MKHFGRRLSVLLVLCLLVSALVPVGSVGAVDITQITITDLAKASSSFATQLKTAVTAGSKDANGVYSDFAFPGKLTHSSQSIETEAFTLMAASALTLLADGSDGSVTIESKAITFQTDTVTGGKGTTLTKGQYLDLAERVVSFAGTLGYLPHSFNRPSDGTKTYDGRITVYSLPLIFAEALAAYSSTGKLPSTVTFVPTHVSAKSTIVDPIEPSESSEESASSEPTEPTETTTAAPTEPVGISLSVIALEGYQIKEFVEENYATPNYSTLSTGDVVYPAQMMYMMCKAIVDISEGSLTNTYDIPTMSEAGNPNGSVTTGKIAKSEYVTLAKNVIAFMDKNSQAPNYCTCSLGTIEFDAAFYFYASILSSYYDKKTLPDSVTVANFSVTIGNLGGTTASSGNATFGADYSSLSAYTVPTSNCQSTNATIIAVAKTGIKYSSGSHGGYANPTNTYQAMFNLMEYLNAKTSYSYYSNTSKGALGTWNAKSGNCCDMAHLMNACARSLGVPARYRHGYCIFSSGLRTGHVWAEVYCGSSYGWKTADLVSASNYLGYKTSTTSYYMSGDKTITLPF